MRVNERIAISTSKILLVPYDAHHVERYHEWMQNEALREATASDLLSLAEEYENQQSWRTAHDKLTFIVCLPVSPKDTESDIVMAGEDDAPPRMVGDVNLFLTPCDDDDDNENENGNEGDSEMRDVKGEIDIMIAAPAHRRNGLGEATVRAFLLFLARNHTEIMREHVRGPHDVNTPGAVKGGSIEAETEMKTKIARIKRLVAKIHADNAGSIRLFENLGFRRHGDPDYFNEISMRLDFPPATATAAPAGVEGSEPGLGDGVSKADDVLGYRECFYDRSRLKK